MALTHVEHGALPWSASISGGGGLGTRRCFELLRGGFDSAHPLPMSRGIRSLPRGTSPLGHSYVPIDYRRGRHPLKMESVGSIPRRDANMRSWRKDTQRHLKRRIDRDRYPTTAPIWDTGGTADASGSEPDARNGVRVQILRVPPTPSEWRNSSRAGPRSLFRKECRCDSCRGCQLCPVGAKQTQVVSKAASLGAIPRRGTNYASGIRA